MSDEVLSQLVRALGEMSTTLIEIRDEIRLLRAVGMTKPLPLGGCLRCERPGTPVERIGEHDVCLSCLERTIDEAAIQFHYQKTTGLAKALAEGKTSHRWGYAGEMTTDSVPVTEAGSKMLAS